MVDREKNHYETAYWMEYLVLVSVYGTTVNNVQLSPLLFVSPFKFEWKREKTCEDDTNLQSICINTTRRLQIFFHNFSAWFFHVFSFLIHLFAFVAGFDAIYSIFVILFQCFFPLSLLSSSLMLDSLSIPNVFHIQQCFCLRKKMYTAKICNRRYYGLFFSVSS